MRGPNSGREEGVLRRVWPGICPVCFQQAACRLFAEHSARLQGRSAMPIPLLLRTGASPTLKALTSAAALSWCVPYPQSFDLSETVHEAEEDSDCATGHLPFKEAIATPTLHSTLARAHMLPALTTLPALQQSAGARYLP